jgi:hypothetical protein
MQYSLHSEHRLIHFGLEGFTEPPQHLNNDGTAESPDQRSQRINSSYPPDHARKLKLEYAAHNNVEQQEKKAAEQEMNKKLAEMPNPREDNTISLKGLNVRPGDLVMRFPDGSRVVFQRTPTGDYERVGGGRRIVLTDRQDINDFARDSDARYRFAPTP